MSLEKIKKCIGDPDADEENQVLKFEQAFQVRFVKIHSAVSSFFHDIFKVHAQLGQENRGVVTIFPTLIINNAQYRGKLFFLIDHHKVVKIIRILLCSKLR